ncbi:MAG: hypothetical protein FJZ16_00545 [Candidatus Omnitrophica bacterium]|nr:hypothetical protein [Candidatus Omnitrophota bacterium]
MKDDLWNPSSEERQTVIDDLRNLRNDILRQIKNFIIDIAMVSRYTRRTTSDPRLKKKTTWERLVESGKKEDLKELSKLLEKIIEAKKIPERDKMDWELIRQIRSRKEVIKWYREACRIKRKISNLVSYKTEAELDYILYGEDPDEEIRKDPLLQFLINGMNKDNFDRPAYPEDIEHPISESLVLTKKAERKQELDEFKIQQGHLEKTKYQDGEEIGGNEIQKVFRKAQRKLPPRQKEAFRLTFLSGPTSYEEVGKKMKINPKTAWEYAQEAKKKITADSELQSLFQKAS